MAICSSILAWEIPRTEKPGRLQSMGSQRVRHSGATECSHTLTHKTRALTNHLPHVLLHEFVPGYLHGKKQRKQRQVTRATRQNGLPNSLVMVKSTLVAIHSFLVLFCICHLRKKNLKVVM